METIIVAAIGATGLIGSTWLGSRKTEKAVKEVRDSIQSVQVNIGQPNGKGNLTQMLESLIEWKGAHMATHRDIDEAIGRDK